LRADVATVDPDRDFVSGRIQTNSCRSAGFSKSFGIRAAIDADGDEKVDSGVRRRRWGPSRAAQHQIDDGFQWIREKMMKFAEKIGRKNLRNLPKKKNWRKNVEIFSF